jgi:hypothetical protein
LAGVFSNMKQISGTLSSWPQQQPLVRGHYQVTFAKKSELTNRVVFTSRTEYAC